MAEAIFTIDGADFSDCIALGGIGWTRNDLDQDGAGRTLDGMMHRKRIASKRQLDMKCVMIPDSRARQLAAALDRETVTVSYPDMQFGNVSKTFYGTKLSSGIWGIRNGVLYWENISFTLTEV